jgi:asparagine synthase (glutamine-hydrolysing)
MTQLQGITICEYKICMVDSLEMRVSFLNNDLVDFSNRFPVTLKSGNFGEVSCIN